MKRIYHSNLAFLDILFNTLLCFVVFFALALINMKKDNESSDNASNIEFDSHIMIVATWPAQFGDDIDLYVRDPRGDVVFFRKKNNALMHLDRDDLGRVGDIEYPGNDMLVSNREIVTIRTKYPGEFIVNAHAYAKTAEQPTPVNIRIYKIQNSDILLDEMIIMDYAGQERTACRFTVTENGNVTNINQLPMIIAGDIVRSTW